MHQPVDFHDRVMFSIREQRAAENLKRGQENLIDLRAERERKAKELKDRPRLNSRADYEVWDCSLGYWRECHFYFAAPDPCEAKRLAVLYCRDNNGQPLDFHNLRVSEEPIAHA